MRVLLFKCCMAEMLRRRRRVLLLVSQLSLSVSAALLNRLEWNRLDNSGSAGLLVLEGDAVTAMELRQQTHSLPAPVNNTDPHGRGAAWRLKAPFHAVQSVCVCVGSMFYLLHAFVVLPQTQRSLLWFQLLRTPASVLLSHWSPALPEFFAAAPWLQSSFPLLPSLCWIPCDEIFCIEDLGYFGFLGCPCLGCRQEWVHLKDPQIKSVFLVF